MPPLDMTAGIWAEASLAGKVPPVGLYRILVKRFLYTVQSAIQFASPY